MFHWKLSELFQKMNVTEYLWEGNQYEMAIYLIPDELIILVSFWNIDWSPARLSKFWFITHYSIKFHEKNIFHKTQILEMNVEKNAITDCFVVIPFKTSWLSTTHHWSSINEPIFH